MNKQNLKFEDMEKRIKIISANNKLLIGKKGILTNSFGGRTKFGLFLDIPLKNGNDEIDLTSDIIFEFTNDIF